MKRVVSVSLGSSKRDHQVYEEFCGESFEIKRVGTNGDKQKAVELIRRLDGRVDALGMGGTDLYIYAGNKRYTFRESAKIAAAAHKTPIVDGSGIKNTLERKVVSYLKDSYGLNFANKKVLVVCAVDRFGLAESLVEAGSQVVFGDLLFGLGIPYPIRSLAGLSKLAKWAGPIVTQLPVSMFYPTGNEQIHIKPRFSEYYHQADIIAGDFHFIRRNMPDKLTNKIIITNTVTRNDEELLRQRGVATLVTTTPEMQGRSFGTNVLEAILVALAEKRPEELTVQEYRALLDKIGVKPRITQYNQ